MSAKSLAALIGMLMFAICLAILLQACQSPQEKSGVSSRPFNTPASWETNPGPGQTIE